MTVILSETKPNDATPTHSYSDGNPLSAFLTKIRKEKSQLKLPAVNSANSGTGYTLERGAALRGFLTPDLPRFSLPPSPLLAPPAVFYQLLPPPLRNTLMTYSSSHSLALPWPVRKPPHLISLMA